MEDQIKELADNLGRAEARVLLGGQELTLRPLTLNDMVASAQDLSGLGVGTLSAAGLRSQLYYCAKRGGWAGTEQELGELVTDLDVANVRLALSRVFPTEIQSVWVRLLDLACEIAEDKKLTALFKPVADAILAAQPGVAAALAGDASGEARPGDGAGSSG